MPLKDPEARREYMRQWQAENREKLRENQKRYQERNKEKNKEYQREYYLKNREKILAREKAYRESNPEEYRKTKREAMRKWRAADPEAYRARSRRHWAKKKYGLTLEEYEAILARGCAICGTKKGSVVGPRGGLKDAPEPRLCIDHDHVSGKVRDALCHKCNATLGQADEDPDRLRAAADYLESHR